MRSLRGGRLIEGGAEDDVLRGGRRNDTIHGNGGDDIIVGRRGRDVMHGGEGFDTFAFDDLHTGDASWGQADAIADFGLEDLIDLRQTEVFRFAGFDNADPGRGAYSIWRGGDHVYVTWNTHGKLQDVELTGFTGDHYALQQHVLWYEDDYGGTIATRSGIAPEGTARAAWRRPGTRTGSRIEVEAGNLYDFDVKGQADGGGTLVDPYLRFFDAEGNFVSEGYEELFFEATKSGTFFVAVQSWSLGTYTLDVTATPYVDDFGDGTDTEGRIAEDETVSGTIGTPSDRDWLRIEMAPDSIYTFTLGGEAEGGGTLRDVELTLFDEAGNWLTAAGSELSFSTEAGGVHFISAGSWSGSVGTYTLEVAAEPYVDDFGSDAATAGAIMPGETVTGVIGAIGDEDWFAIDLEDDATYTIELRGQSSGSGSLAAIRSCACLIPPGRNSRSTMTGSGSTRRSCTLPEATAPTTSLRGSSAAAPATTRSASAIQTPERRRPTCFSSREGYGRARRLRARLSRKGSGGVGSGFGGRARGPAAAARLLGRWLDGLDDRRLGGRVRRLLGFGLDAELAEQEGRHVVAHARDPLGACSGRGRRSDFGAASVGAAEGRSARGSLCRSPGRRSPRRLPRSARRRSGAGSRGAAGSGAASRTSGLGMTGIVIFTSSSILARYFSSAGSARVSDLPERPARPVRPMRWT